MKRKLISIAVPTVAALIAAAALYWTETRHPEDQLTLRLPGADQRPGAQSTSALNPAGAGQLVKGDGQPANLPGAWPGFRGGNHDAISPETTPLARSWDASGPREIWSVPVGEGYGGAAVWNGRLYLIDYERDQQRSALRCLSLADGKQLWRYSYPLSVKSNHGMTRTVPSVTEKGVVAMDPTCNVVCVDPATGALRWAINLVHDFGTTVPPWYAGQCPIIDGDSVILAPGGPDTLMVAVELATGKLLWKTPNPHSWKMTHASITPMEFGGKRTYVYCGSGGVAGISADDGAILWETNAWKISIATVPSPVVLPGGRIFLSGGYNAGSLMLQLKEEGGKILPQTLFKLSPEVFGATQQTPIYRDGFLFGIRPDGQFACLNEAGKAVWSSGQGTQFGLGPFLMAGGLIFAMNDSGRLSLFEANGSKFVPLAEAQVIKDGRESWGPMAIAGNILAVRDLNRLICLDVGAK